MRKKIWENEWGVERKKDETRINILNEREKAMKNRERERERER